MKQKGPVQFAKQTQEGNTAARHHQFPSTLQKRVGVISVFEKSITKHSS